MKNVYSSHNPNFQSYYNYPNLNIGIKTNYNKHFLNKNICNSFDFEVSSEFGFDTLEYDNDYMYRSIFKS